MYISFNLFGQKSSQFKSNNNSETQKLNFVSPQPCIQIQPSNRSPTPSTQSIINIYKSPPLWANKVVVIWPRDLRTKSKSVLHNNYVGKMTSVYVEVIYVTFFLGRHTSPLNCVRQLFPRVI